MSPHVSSVLVAVFTVAGILAVLLLPDQETVSVTILAFLAMESTVFTTFYLWRSNWRATNAGRIILRLVACIAAIGIHGTVNALTAADYPGRDFIRPILLLLVASAVLHLLLRLWWVQRREGQS